MKAAVRTAGNATGNEHQQSTLLHQQAFRSVPWKETALSPTTHTHTHTHIWMLQFSGPSPPEIISEVWWFSLAQLAPCGLPGYCSCPPKSCGGHRYQRKSHNTAEECKPNALLQLNLQKHNQKFEWNVPYFSFFSFGSVHCTQTHIFTHLCLVHLHFTYTQRHNSTAWLSQQCRCDCVVFTEQFTETPPSYKEWETFPGHPQEHLAEVQPFRCYSVVLLFSF